MKGSTAIGARLRAVRESAPYWTRGELARMLRDQATPAELPHVAHVASLTDMIKQWEAGKWRPSPRYRALYCRLTGRVEADLFGQGDDRAADLGDVAAVGAEERDRLILAARNPARLDTTVIDSLVDTLATQRHLDDVLGSRAVIDAATSHLGLILSMLKHGRGPLAGRLAAVASGASQFVGWLNTAVSQHAAASPLYDQALRLGLQAGNTDLAATALSMRGHLAWVTGEYADMAGLSQAAADMATVPETRTVAVQQRGRALALMGDRQGALRAIGAAEDHLAAAGGSAGGDPESLYFYSSELLTAQRGLILNYLADRPDEHTAAADTITSAIEELPPEIRDSEWLAWYRVQAAAAAAAGGELEQAVSMLRSALEIVTATDGTKTLRDIVGVHRSLARRWPDHPEVAELADVLGTIA